MFPGRTPLRCAAYCFVTVMLFALVVGAYPAVWLVNDPASEPNVRAVCIAPDFGGRLGLTVTLRAPAGVAFELTWSLELFSEGI